MLRFLLLGSVAAGGVFAYALFNSDMPQAPALAVGQVGEGGGWEGHSSGSPGFTLPVGQVGQRGREGGEGPCGSLQVWWRTLGARGRDCLLPFFTAAELCFELSTSPTWRPWWD